MEVSQKCLLVEQPQADKGHKSALACEERVEMPKSEHGTHWIIVQKNTSFVK